jgi:hypothetical protein
MTLAAPQVAQASPAVKCAATPIPVVPHMTSESPAAPRATTAPLVGTDGPPPHEWLSSPTVYTKRRCQPAPSMPMGPTSTTPDR